MATTRTQEGLVYIDDFSGTLAGWTTTAGAPSIVASELNMPAGGSQIRETGAALEQEMVVFGTVRLAAGAASGPMVRNSADGHGYYYQFEHLGQVISIFLRNPGYSYLGLSPAFAFASGVNVPYKIHAADNFQRIWAGAGLLIATTNNAGQNGKAGSGGHHGNNGHVGDIYARCKNNNIVANSMPAGHKIRVAGNVAVEVGGVATLDYANGMTPVAAASIEFLDPSDNVLEDFFPGVPAAGGVAGVYPGDIYNFDPPVLLDPPGAFTYPLGGENLVVASILPVSWGAAPVADSYSLSYKKDGGALTLIANGILTTNYNWDTLLLGPGEYELHVRAVSGANFSPYVTSNLFDLSAVLDPVIITPTATNYETVVPIQWTHNPLNGIAEIGFLIEWRPDPLTAWDTVEIIPSGGVYEYLWDRPTGLVTPNAQIQITAVHDRGPISNTIESVEFRFPPLGMTYYMQKIFALICEEYYPLNELAGSDLIDWSGNGRDGVYINTHTKNQTPLVIGSPSVDFAGGGYVDVPAVDISNKSFAIIMWITTPADIATARHIYDAYQSDFGSHHVSLTVHNSGGGGSFIFDFYGGGVASAGGSILPSTKYFLVARFIHDPVTPANGIASVWIDGIKVAEVMRGPMLLPPTQAAFMAFYEGSLSGNCIGQHFAVLINDNTPTDAEILDLWNAGSNPAPVYITPEEGGRYENLIPVEWVNDGADVEGDYSLNDGASWIPLFVLQTATLFNWDTSLIPNTAGILIRIRAIRGVVYSEYTIRRVSVWRIIFPNTSILAGITAKSDHSIRVTVPVDLNIDYVRVQIDTYPAGDFSAPLADVGPGTTPVSPNETWVTGLIPNTKYLERHQIVYTVGPPGAWSNIVRFRTMNIKWFADHWDDPVYPTNTKIFALDEIGNHDGTYGSYEQPYMQAFEARTIGEPAIQLLDKSSTGDPRKYGVRVNMQHDEVITPYDQTLPFYRNRIIRFAGADLKPGYTLVDRSPFSFMLAFVPYDPGDISAIREIMGNHYGIYVYHQNGQAYARVLYVTVFDSGFGSSQIRTATLHPLGPIVYNQLNIIIVTMLHPLVNYGFNLCSFIDIEGYDIAHGPGAFDRDQSIEIFGYLNNGSRRGVSGQKPMLHTKTYLSTAPECGVGFISGPGDVLVPYHQSIWDFGKGSYNAINFDRGFEGILVEGAIWHKVLTETEARTIMSDLGFPNFESTVKSTDPYIYTRFTEYPGPRLPVLTVG